MVGIVVAGVVGAEEARVERPVWGTVVVAGEGSVTVQPIAPARRRARRGAPREEVPPPAEQVIPVGKDRTEVMFAEVGREMLTADGGSVRAFNDPVPAALEDLKPGRRVEVTVRDGVATRIIIAWGERGTVVRAGADSVTYRPEAKEGEVPQERTVAAGRDTTRVTVRVLAEAGPAEGGRFFQRYESKAGRLEDLKEGQRVVVCEKEGAAVKVTVLAEGAGRE
jgi:hypothetical protein